jgi:hypothetical protein
VLPSVVHRGSVMMLTGDVVSSALDAVKGGAKLQSTLRTYIEECHEIDWKHEITANAVASMCTTFHSKVSKWANAGEYEEGAIDSVKARRKAVNNIINDISRICRAELGHTIRCTSRKGGHVYTASKVAPTPLRTTTDKDLTIEPKGPAMSGLIEGVAMKELAALNTMLDNDLEASLKRLHENFSYEAMGRVVMDRLKARAKKVEEYNPCEEIPF